ncbi:hypothetical protein [Roseimarinus sediminis]|uniref:hypothetical protein n=1 Tax=Roseimarinus sediminis TaxID=1610899 RepID=UPI003D2541CF
MNEAATRQRPKDLSALKREGRKMMEVIVMKEMSPTPRGIFVKKDQAPSTDGCIIA